MGPGENAKLCETVQCACAKVLINVRGGRGLVVFCC